MGEGQVNISVRFWKSWRYRGYRGTRDYVRLYRAPMYFSSCVCWSPSQTQYHLLVVSYSTRPSQAYFNKENSLRMPHYISFSPSMRREIPLCLSRPFHRPTVTTPLLSKRYQAASKTIRPLPDNQTRPRPIALGHHRRHSVQSQQRRIPAHTPAISSAIAAFPQVLWI